MSFTVWCFWPAYLLARWLVCPFWWWIRQQIHLFHADTSKRDSLQLKDLICCWWVGNKVTGYPSLSLSSIKDKIQLLCEADMHHTQQERILQHLIFFELGSMPPLMLCSPQHSHSDIRAWVCQWSYTWWRIEESRWCWGRYPWGKRSRDDQAFGSLIK